MENRLVYNEIPDGKDYGKRLDEIRRAHNANDKLEEARHNDKRLPAFLNPTQIARAAKTMRASNNINLADHWTDLMAKPNVKVTSDHLYNFATLIHSTGYKKAYLDQIDNFWSDDTERTFEDLLREYMDVRKKDRNGKLNGDMALFEEYLDDVYWGMADYYIHWNEIADQSQGGIASLGEDMTDNALDMVQEMTNAYDESGLLGKVVGGGAMVAIGAYIALTQGADDDGNTTIAGHLRNAMLWVAGAFTVAGAATVGSKVTTGLWLSEHMDKANVSADHESMAAYFRFQGEDRDSVMEKVMFLSLFRPVGDRRASELRKKYMEAKMDGGVSEENRAISLLEYGVREDQEDGHEAYLAMGCVFEQIERLKRDNPPLGFELDHAINMGASMREVYLRMQKDYRAYNVEDYHTAVAGRAFSWFTDHRDSERVGADFDDSAQIAALNEWAKGTYLYPVSSVGTDYKEKQPTKDDWWTMGNRYANRDQLAASPWGAIITAGLNEKSEDAEGHRSGVRGPNLNPVLAGHSPMQAERASYVGDRYLVVEVPGYPSDYKKTIKNAYETALDKYNIEAEGADIGLEASFGAILTQEGAGKVPRYVAVFRQVSPEDYHPLEDGES